MDQVHQRASITKIIRSDYPAFFGLAATGVTWALYAATAYFGYVPGFRGRDPLTRSDAPFFLYLALAVTVIAIPLVIWRVRSIQAVFAGGIEAVGRITGVAFRRDRGRVEYTYTVKDQTFHGGSAIMKTGQTKRLVVGEEVVVVVDPDNPKRALLRELYG